MDQREILSVVFLVLIALWPVCWVVLVYKSARLTWLQLFCWFLSQLISRFLWRAQVPQKFPIPHGRGAVVICNHRSSVDPFFVQLVLDRPMHWMVAGEYFKQPAVGWFLRLTEAIPTNRRGVDTAATKSAIRLARQGGLIGMFPEGRINHSQEFMLPSRPGAILVATKAGIPILPCYIEGSPYGDSVASPFFMRARVRVRFGRPINVVHEATRDDRQTAALMIRCLKEIARLAGRDDFEPKLAGRRWLTDNSTST